MGKVSRNAPCPCGSGRKFKQCCLKAKRLPLSANSAHGLNATADIQRAAWQRARLPDFADECFHLHHRPDLQFWLRCCRTYGRPKGGILELCCGSGIMAAAIADTGYNVVAVDTNPECIERARLADQTIRRPAVGPNASTVEYLVQDVRRLHLERRFSLIIMVNSFGYLLTEDDQRLCLERVGSHLEDGGTFVFDVYEAHVHTDGTIGPKNPAGLRCRHQIGDDPHVWGISGPSPMFERFATWGELETLLSFADLKTMNREEIYVKEDNSGVAVIATKTRLG